MNKLHKHPLHDHDSAGSRVRLAQGPIAAVDVCSCGTLHLQLGALTLRLGPDALASLMSTLGEALAAHAERFDRRIDTPAELPDLSRLRPRGRA